MSRIVLDLMELVGRLPVGSTVDVPIEVGDEPTVKAWCERTGNQLVEVKQEEHQVAVVRRGQAAALPDPIEELPAEQRPGARLWLYTNFDCNLACDYCCSRSSPRTPRQALGVERVRRIVREAAELDVSEVFLTGGEPFLLTDLDDIVAACTQRFPTTLLTNGMLFRGRRFDMLLRMPRDRLTLQISLDSPTPARHDRHRGRGSWERALDGVKTARAEGFRVRVAATVVADERDAAEDRAFHSLLDEIGIAPEDQVIRPVALRGFAEDGVVVTPETLIPEVTITAAGVYWHPVGADHLDQLVTRDIFPLATAVTEVRRRFADYRRTANAAAQRFPCA